MLKCAALMVMLVAAPAFADEGARSVLAAHPDWLRRVEVGGLPPDDIDTEEGYERMKAEFGKA